MDDEVQGKSGGMRPSLRALLVVSLALNLLILGAAGGAMMTWSKWKPHHPSRMDMAGGPLTRALSHEDRRAIGRQMREAYRQGGVPHADLRAELEGLVNDLRAEPFDAAAVEERLARHRSVFDARFALGQSLLLERLRQMSPDDRQAYADRLHDALRRRGADRHRKLETE